MEPCETKTAYHESGHAVMVILMGGKVHSVTLEPNNETGLARYGETIAVWPTMPTLQSISAQICVSLAGPVAEMLYEGETLDLAKVPEWAADWFHIEAHAAKLSSMTGGQTLADTTIKECQDRVAESLQRENHWAAVAALADELLTHETLECAQVHDVVEFWLRRE